MAALLEVMELDFRESLKKTEVPALLLYGEHSNMTTAANRSFMKDTIPDSKLIVFHESGHNPMIEEWQKFNDAVGAFVRDL
jgi:pimeloyl-ACP methyl ester carboxylesterase